MEFWAFSDARESCVLMRDDANRYVDACRCAPPDLPAKMSGFYEPYTGCSEPPGVGRTATSCQVDHASDGTRSADRAGLAAMLLPRR